MKGRQGKVCVFGAFNLDIVVNVPRFPLPGESLIGDSSLIGPGGKGANQATAAARAGARVHYIGKIGQDEYGQFARRHLSSAGMEVVTLFESATHATGNALIYVARGDAENSAENMIAVVPGANLTVTEEEIGRCLPAIHACDILLTQLETNVDAVQTLLACAREHNVFTILNPAPYQPVPSSLLRHVDLLTPNTTEAALMTGMSIQSPQEARYAAQRLRQMGCGQVIITLGGQGALFDDGRQALLLPCYPATPVDTTGAGDAFNGALAAGLARGESLLQSTRFAAAYASVSVERRGAAIAMPTREEALSRMERYGDTYRVERVG